jgi:hypothetical protein
VAVNHLVAGSSPARGAIKIKGLSLIGLALYLFRYHIGTNRA